jgi:hypothetical protein
MVQELTKRDFVAARAPDDFQERLIHDAQEKSCQATVESCQRTGTACTILPASVAVKKANRESQCGKKAKEESFKTLRRFGALMNKVVARGTYFGLLSVQRRTTRSPAAASARFKAFVASITSRMPAFQRRLTASRE